jgi:PQQ-dependent catabolism-associated CXXCW motif protein
MTELPRLISRLVLVMFGVLAFVGTAPALAPAGSALFEDDGGYRISRYRAPTPDTVPGGTRIDIDEFDRLAKDANAILVDVMIAEGAGPDPKTGKWRLTKQRRSIPGAVWLANVGIGLPDPAIDAYFAKNLKQLTDGDFDRPIIMFCLADCWMSWNAIKRAAALGYTQLYWYSDGTDGWRDWDRPFTDITPVPLQPPVQLADASGVGEALTLDATPGTPILPTGTKTATLVSHDGKRLEIATVTFKPTETPGHVGFSVSLDSNVFGEEFLSMRPFQCIPDADEMWCHLSYPYESNKQISATDLQDLEYAFLFLFKPPNAYGIDAWNGLYFKLDLQPDGTLAGSVHETDMNVLAVPPEKGDLRPISHGALSEVDANTHRFARIEIK